MKKIVSLLMALIFAASCVPVVMAEDSKDEYIVYEDFEDFTKGTLPKGWTDGTTGVKAGNVDCGAPTTGVNAEFERVGRGLKVYGKGGFQIRRFIEPITDGRVLITVDVNASKMSEGTEPQLYFADKDESQRNAAWLWPEKHGDAVAAEAEANDGWFTLNILIDIDKSTYEAWGNDHTEAKTTGVSDVKSLEQIAFVVWQEKNPMDYVEADNLKIFKFPLTLRPGEFVTPGNIFTDGMEQKIPVVVINDGKAEKTVKLDYIAKTRNGTVLYESSEDITIKGNSEYTKDVILNLERYDLGVLYVTMTESDGTVHNIDIDFSHTKVAGSTNPKYGIGSHDLRGPRGDMEYKAKLLSDAGFGFYRDEVEWHRTETTKGDYQLLAGHQQYFNDLKEYGVDSLIVLGLGNPLYDNKGAPASEEAQNAYVEYAKFIVQNFKGCGINAYEIWNEWDLFGHVSFNPSSQPPEVYRELIKKTSKAIKEVDPNAIVMAPAMANITSESFLRAVFEDGGYEALDVISFHPYDHRTSPEEGNLVSLVERAKKVMREFGEEKPIWMTERGYFWVESDSRGPKSEEEQAAWAARQYLLVEGLDLADKIFYYCAWNGGTNIDYSENNYGLTKAETGVMVPYAAKSGYLAMANMHSFINNAKLEKMHTPDSRTYLSDYKMNDGRDLLVAWSLDRKDTIAIKNDSPVEAFDMYGNSFGYIYPENGVLNLSIFYEPLYLVGNIPEIESIEPNIKCENEYREACTEDVLSYKITVPNSDGYRLEVTSCNGIELKENKGFTGGIGEFTLYTTGEMPDLGRCNVAVLNHDGQQVLSGEYMIKRNKTEVDVSILMEPDANNPNRWKTKVSITNNAESKNASGTVSIKAPEAFAEYATPVSFSNIRPKETATVYINLPEMVKKKAETVITEVKLDSGFVGDYSKLSSFAIADYAKNDITVDGIKEDGEWTSTLLFMDSSTYNTADGISEPYQGDADCYAKAQTMWDEENFYMFIEVTDNSFCQNYTGNYIYRGDSFQFGIDEVSNGAIYATEYNELGGALTPEGETYMYRWRSVDKRDSEVKNYDLAVKREGNTTYYEMRLGWDELLSNPENVSELYDIGFAMLVNDADVKDRKGWVEYTSGVGRGKLTSLFGRLILGKKD